MNASLKLLTLAGVLCAGILSLHAADKKHLAGPKGGRLLENTGPKAEFYLEKDHAVTITFYDAALKPVPASTQSVTVVAEAKDGKKTLEFEKKGDVLVSKTKLPEGDGYNVVVQFKQTADARPQNFRFKLETHQCGGCKRAEYACTCDE
jgi:CheY-like chemotaxis protein